MLRWDTFGGLLAITMLILFAFLGLATLAPCIDNYGVCPL